MKTKIKIFVSALAAGFLIGIGGTVYLSAENRAVGAVLFAVGLFAILSFGLHLFTGKACYILDNKPAFLLDVLIIWLGNLGGTFVAATLIRVTRVSSAIIEKAAVICQTKLDDGFLSLFVLGIFCGMLMFIAVNCHNNLTNPVGKYIAVFVCVPVFILCGFEHCIANMFYFSVADMWSPLALLGLVGVTLGNIAGGVTLPMVKRFIASKI